MLKRMKLALGIAALSLLGGFSANGQEQVAPNPPFEFTGYVDFYYQQSSQAHLYGASGPAVLEARAFDRLNDSLTLNMAEVSAKKKFGKVGFRIDLAFGEMVDVLSGYVSTSTTSNPAAFEPTRNITQAFVTYAPIENLTLTAGKFYSYVGYEVVKAKENWNYSRSFTFNYGVPFWHQGVSVGYGFLPGVFSGTLYVLNAWDGRIAQEQNRSPTLGANFNFTPLEGLTVNYNYIGGPEFGGTDSLRQVHEVNASYVINPVVSVATDLVFGRQDMAIGQMDATWSGYVFYAKVTPIEWYTLSPRYEIFDDTNQGFAVAGGLSPTGTFIKQKIQSLTITNIFSLVEGLEARLEFRADRSDVNGLFKTSDGADTDHQESYTVAVLYSL